MVFDLSTFDFAKWKKCVSRVLTDYQSNLLFEGDPQGEELLRYEVSRYLYSSRGVRCNPDSVLIAAGTQQITSILATMLRQLKIDHVSVEEPGYQPVITSFANRGFALSHIPVRTDGIAIERLPGNIRSAVYTSPSNQFPTGAVMPIRRRYELLEWARENDSYIIEDDYDSELRYIGKPIPALQGLDTKDRVIYLGSFSSTLFSAIKISYMVMPAALSDIFRTIAGQYTQTCSKTEQLALGLFMEQGSYQTGIKKLRRLNGQKLQAVIAAFSKGRGVETVNTHSGINIMLKVKTHKSGVTLQKEAEELGLLAVPLAGEKGLQHMNFYFNQLPLSEIPKLIEALLEKW
ncbi:MAG: PLP-dependent aminotransferase family protein [Firmicutes bacterium]|nr:PLP-dependent aminotransferase family protein [Bacillota bacterium]